MARHIARTVLAALAVGAALATAGCSADSGPPQESGTRASADSMTHAGTSEGSSSPEEPQGSAAPGSASAPQSAAQRTEAPDAAATSGTSPHESRAPWCTTAALTPSLHPLESAAGSRYTALVLANTSGTACRTQGWPGLQLVDATGKPLPTDAVRDHSRSPRPLTLQPGESSWSRLHWSVVAGEEDPADGRCPSPAQIRITPPDQHDPDSASWGELGTICGGGKIDVQPLSEGSGPPVH